MQVFVHQAIIIILGIYAQHLAPWDPKNYFSGGLRVPVPTYFLSLSFFSFSLQHGTFAERYL